MIKVLTEEYREGNLAVQTTVITFFRIPIFKLKKTSTNNRVVAALSTAKKSIKINGFV